MASQKNSDNKTALENVAATSDATVSRTQPKNPQPKSNTSRRSRRDWENSFKPGQHGLLVRNTVNSARKPVDAIQELYRSLIYRFDPDTTDVVGMLLVELTVVDYWRMSKALEYEQDSMVRHCVLSNMNTLTRYAAAARRNFDKSLQMLLQIEKENGEAAAFALDSGASEAPGSVTNSSQPSEASATVKLDPSAHLTTSTDASSAEQHGAQPPAEHTSAPEEPQAQSSNQQESGAPAPPPAAMTVPPTNATSAKPTTLAESPAAEAEMQTTAGETPATDFPEAA